MMRLTLPHNRVLMLDRPRMVGVLNLTPDSFSDGGKYPRIEDAIAAAETMLEEGADVIDVGGESTRPGATRIAAEIQKQRILPVIERIVVQFNAVVSVDTAMAEVAEAALDAGAAIINDVSAGGDPRMFSLSAERGAPIILMHMRGEPATMQDDPAYGDVVAEVREFLVQRAEAAQGAGVRREQIVIDPGIGFGKTVEHNLELMSNLGQLVATGYPVMLGASRKRFLGAISGRAEPSDRDAATAATTVIGVMAGVQLFRVHNVAINREAADVARALAGMTNLDRPRAYP